MPGASTGRPVLLLFDARSQYWMPGASSARQKPVLDTGAISSTRLEQVVDVVSEGCANDI